MQVGHESSRSHRRRNLQDRTIPGEQTAFGGKNRCTCLPGSEKTDGHKPAEVGREGLAVGKKEAWGGEFRVDQFQHLRTDFVH